MVAHLGGASITATHIRVLDTQARACAETTCAEAPFGSGVGSFGDAHVTLDAFEVRGGPLCGLHLVDADADLSNGTVAGFSTAVCLQTEDYDLRRLQNDVRFVDNALAIEATELPVPEVAAPVDGF